MSGQIHLKEKIENVYGETKETVKPVTDYDMKKKKEMEEYALRMTYGEMRVYYPIIKKSNFYMEQ